jgi:hypothetical protein
MADAGGEFNPNPGVGIGGLLPGGLEGLDVRGVIEAGFFLSGRTEKWQLSDWLAILKNQVGFKNFFF